MSKAKKFKKKKRTTNVFKTRPARFSDQLLNMTEEQAKVKLGELMPSLMVDAGTATERLFEMAEGSVEFTHSEYWVLANAILKTGHWHIAHAAIASFESGRQLVPTFYEILTAHYLFCGAMVDAVDSQGRSLLDTACEGNDYVAVGVLKKGAKINDQLISRLEQERNWYVLGEVASQFSNLMTPARSTEWLGGLVEDEQIDDEFGRTFFYALLAAGADPNVGEGSALSLTVESYEDDMAFALIEAGADIYLLDDETHHEIVKNSEFMPKTRAAYHRLELRKKSEKTKSNKRAWVQGMTTERRAL